VEYLTALILAFTHTTTSIVFLFSLAIYFLAEKKNRPTTTALFLIVLVPFMYLHFGDTAKDLAITPAADFISWTSFLSYSFPIILLALFGLKSFMKSTRGSFFFSFCFAAIIFRSCTFRSMNAFSYSPISPCFLIAAYGAVDLLNSARALGKKHARFIFIGMRFFLYSAPQEFLPTAL